MGNCHGPREKDKEKKVIEGTEGKELKCPEWEELNSINQKHLKCTKHNKCVPGISQKHTCHYGYLLYQVHEHEMNVEKLSKEKQLDFDKTHGVYPPRFGDLVKELDKESSYTSSMCGCCFLDINMFCQDCEFVSCSCPTFYSTFSFKFCFGKKDVKGAQQSMTEGKIISKENQKMQSNQKE